MNELNPEPAPEKVNSIAFDYFSFPFNSDDFFEPMESLIPTLEPGLPAIAKAFRKNLSGVASVSWLPAQMATASDEI